MMKMESELTAFLAIRPGEYRQYFEEYPHIVDKWQGVYVYKVALVETPPLPDDHHTISENLTVICAQKYPTIIDERNLWSWIHLEQHTKEQIGNDLVEWNVQPGTWVYMALSLFQLEPPEYMKLRKG